MNLKEQTVYIPTKNTTNTFLSIRRGVNVLYQSDVIKKQNQICLSKEELIELLGIAWKGGKDFENAGWNNQEYLMGLPEIPKEQFINQLIR